MNSKRLLIFFSFLILFLPVNTVGAMDETRTKYFGVGATVEEFEQATFKVVTEGEKAGEGFVFTPEDIQAGKLVQFQVSLNGDGTVYLKMSESDAKGRYIREHSSPMILLKKDWTQYTLNANLDQNTKQIDVLVVTDGIQHTTFQFRDIVIK